MRPCGEPQCPSKDGNFKTAAALLPVEVVHRHPVDTRADVGTAAANEGLDIIQQEALDISGDADEG